MKLKELTEPWRGYWPVIEEEQIRVQENKQGLVHVLQFTEKGSGEVESRRLVAAIRKVEIENRFQSSGTSRPRVLKLQEE